VADLYEHDERSTDAIDFALVHADDAFLDALGSARPGRIEPLGEDRLAELLLCWRQDVDAEPIPEPIDDKLAVVTVRAARMRRHRIHRLLVPLSVAAASLAIVFAWVGLAAQDARPGDTLWGLMKVLYADRARSVEAAVAVDTSLRQAEEALAKGRMAEAKTKLDEVRSTLPTVLTEDGQADLQARTDELLAMLPGSPVGGVAQPPQAAPSTAAGTPSTGAMSTAPQAPAPTAQSTTAPTTTTAPPPVTTTTQLPQVETTAPNTEPNTEPNGKSSKKVAPTGR
jgi:hypothetical protein